MKAYQLVYSCQSSNPTNKLSGVLPPKEITRVVGLQVETVMVERGKTLGCAVQEVDSSEEKKDGGFGGGGDVIEFS